MTTTYLAPPPTSNLLDARQRTRLMRSTRKLGAVLGTTPRLLEDEVPFTPALVSETRTPLSPEEKRCLHRARRQGSIFTYPPPAAAFYEGTSSASSSATSLSSSQIHASTRWHPQAQPLPPLPPPKSFATHRRDRSEGGKRKAAPLPAPLVLRLNAVPLPPSDPRLHQPCTPETATLFSTTTTASLPRTPSTPLTPVATVTETRRKRLAKLQRTLGENVPPELVFPFKTVRKTSPSPMPASVADTPRAESPPPLPMSMPAQQSRVDRPATPRRAEVARKRSIAVDYKTGVSPASPGLWATGATDWRGEWNRRDIREVQHQLRRLK